MSVNKEINFIDEETASSAQAAGEYFETYLKINRALTEISGKRPTDLAIEKAMDILPSIASPISGEPVPYTLEDLTPKNPNQIANAQEKHIEIFPGNAVPISEHAARSSIVTPEKRIA